MDPTGMMPCDPEDDNYEICEWGAVKEAEWAAIDAGHDPFDVWNANYNTSGLSSGNYQESLSIKKINYHTAGDQQLINQILVYLLILQAYERKTGSLLSIFDYTNAAGIQIGGGEGSFASYRTLQGNTVVEGNRFPLAIAVGTPSSFVLSERVTTFDVRVSVTEVPYRGRPITNAEMRAPDGFSSPAPFVLRFSLNNRDFNSFYRKFLAPSNYGFNVR